MADKKTLIVREKFIDTIRNFFKKNGFAEVETPIMVACPDPSIYTEVFSTSFLTGREAFLAPSPEFFMKKILATGLPKIFQICKAFRNPSETDQLHNPEFTILEWYRVGATYINLMADCENLINYILKNLPQKNQKLKSKKQKHVLKRKNNLTYQEQKIVVSPPWIRISVKEAFEKYARINLDGFLNFKKAREIAVKKGYKLGKKTAWEQLYHQVFLNEIEPKLPKDKPVILYDYPAALAEGAKLKNADSRYAERFEFYISGLELGNGYSELTNWRQQEKRFKKHLEERKKSEMKIFDYDRDFIKTLKRGIPECAGIAVGIDRLLMLFTDSKTIQEVIPFPATKIFL